MITTIYFLLAPHCQKQNNLGLVLCQKGYDQATHLGIELRGTMIDHILCSPLPYARQTAIEIQRLHLEYDPPIELYSKLISSPILSSEEVLCENIENVLDYILEDFRGKSVLLISYEGMAQAFIAHHVGEPLGTVKTQWPTIEHGDIICRQFIED